MVRGKQKQLVGGLQRERGSSEKEWGASVQALTCDKHVWSHACCVADHQDDHEAAADGAEVPALYEQASRARACFNDLLI